MNLLTRTKLAITQVLCHLSGMFNAFRSKFDAETAIKQLRDEMETKFRLVKSEWIQYLTSIEDVHDKLDHIVKRHDKRQQRAKPPPDSAEVELDPDPVSSRVAERRQYRGISSQQG